MYSFPSACRGNVGRASAYFNLSGHASPILKRDLESAGEGIGLEFICYILNCLNESPAITFTRCMSKIKPDDGNSIVTWLVKAVDYDEVNLFFRLGFFGFGDAEKAVDPRNFDSQEDFTKALKSGGYSDKPRSYFWWISKEMKSGDIVYLCREETVLLAVGKVTAGQSYQFSQSPKDSGRTSRKDFAHSIGVDWELVPSQSIDIYDDPVVGLGYKWSYPIRKLNENYSGNPEKLNYISRHFMFKHPLNLISYGPPGTGKTYHAITRAVAICNRKSADLAKVRQEGRQVVEKEFYELMANGRVVFITFHQSYDYTDFICGIRPALDQKGALSYELTKGPLYRIAKVAEAELVLSAKQNRPPEPYVLIIDEINRGNVAKIFGEMITLLEEDKRWLPTAGEGLGIPLVYDEKGAKPFRLPANLYVIGTMNSSDRSVQKLDSALRRRFNFEAEDPDPEQLSDGLKGLKDFLAALNDRLEKARPGAGCQVGHAWFMQFGVPMKEPLSIIEALNEKVFPLLQEWFWDGDETLRQLLQVKSDEGKRKSSDHIASKGRLRFIGNAEDLDHFLRSFTA